MALRCKLFGHRADRKGAGPNGENFWTGCVRCGARLILDDKLWRAATERELHDIRARQAIEARERMKRGM